MRQIKFRGKNNGLWWYAEYKPDGDMGEWEQFWALVDGKTVGQFTGSQDRNGKDIYEGDILKAYPYGWEQPGQRVVFYAVVFSEFEGMWVLKDERPIEDCPSLYSGGIKSRKNERLEVIGNIYETPDLLAKEQ